MNFHISPSRTLNWPLQASATVNLFTILIYNIERKIVSAKNLNQTGFIQVMRRNFHGAGKIHRFDKGFSKY
jgi:hypothetical protein